MAAKYIISQTDRFYQVTQIDDPGVTMSNDFKTYLQRDDIDNNEDNYLIGETVNFFPRFASLSFTCPVPFDSDVWRRAFPSVHKFGDYIFLAYMAGNTHSPNALEPWFLEFARSSDSGFNFETLPIKCILDGGEMRAIDPDIDGYFPQFAQFAYANNKVYCFFFTLAFNPDPPVDAGDYEPHKTYMAVSDDYGDTWSESEILDDTVYGISSAKPIIVGNEIWLPCYYPANFYGPTLLLESYILRYNFVTDTIGAKTQMDASWTGLYTAEPTILEYAPGKFMCMARVVWNANFPGAETEHLGEVEAYSTNGIDWSNYTWHDSDHAPNMPLLFMFGDYVYYSRNKFILHGTVSDDESEIEWILREDFPGDWYADYAYTFFQMFRTADGGYIKRYDPREGHEGEQLELLAEGGASFCVLDESSETLLAVRGYKEDGGTFVGEPWLSIIKRSGVGTGPTYTERLIYLTEIPGDSDVSNEMEIWNDWIDSGDTVVAYWYDETDKPTYSISVANVLNGITFTSSEKVAMAKIVYEIIK